MGGFAGSWDGTEPDGDGFPRRSMPGGWASQGMGDLMEQGIEHGFPGTVPGIVFRNLDPLRLVFADTETTLGIPEPEGPLMQTMLGHFAAGDGCQLIQIHTAHP
jgi:hypothetical protein